MRLYGRNIGAEAGRAGPHGQGLRSEQWRVGANCGQKACTHMFEHTQLVQQGGGPIYRAKLAACELPALQRQSHRLGAELQDGVDISSTQRCTHKENSMR